MVAWARIAAVGGVSSRASVYLGDRVNIRMYCTWRGRKETNQK